MRKNSLLKTINKISFFGSKIFAKTKCEKRERSIPNEREKGKKLKTNCY